MGSISRQQFSEDQNIVFICGLYKCGTSWLLQALSRYSQAVGLREIDLLKLTHQAKPPFKAFAKETMLANILGRNAWCRITGEQLELMHKELKGKSPTRYYEALSQFKPKNCRPLQDRQHDPSELTIPLTFFDLPPERAIELIDKLFLADSGEQVIQAFKDTYDPIIKAPYKLVLKGADQIVMLPVLNNAYPQSKKIVILRDGRDAAISAFYYRKLQLEKSAPWVGAMKEPLEFLKDWKGRAHKVLEAARKNDLAVVRYEDLLENFEGQFGRILNWLNWDYLPSEVEAIKKSCSFEAQTGRKRGENARDVRRKGISGEWMSFFSPEEKDRAWTLAGDFLEAFGYTRQGHMSSDFPGKV